MAAFRATSLFLYRWRYVIGYGVIGLALITLLILCGFFVPGGISAAETRSVITSGSLSIHHPNSLAIINLPYYMLQAVSIHFLGVHDFSIKLPSLILGFLSALGIIVLLSRWFHRNIAVMASFIAITTGQFLFVSQNGTPDILYIFWPVTLLLLGVLISRSRGYRFIWKVLIFVVAALSLYTPLSIYPLVAMVLAALLHPHLRTIIRRLSKVKLTVAVIVGLIIITPLMYGVILHPQIGLSLLGVPSHWPNLLANLHTLAHQYLDFWNPSTTSVMTPVFGLGSVFLIAYGAYRVIRTSATTQSYLIIAWIICLIPVLLINPSLMSVTFVPLLLLLTIGLDSLVHYWYRLFPLNPYARFVGIIPLLILILALVSTGLDRYVYGYRYQPETVQNFSKDLELLPTSTRQLVVAPSELAFYQVVAKHTPGLVVSDTAPQSSTFVATHNAAQSYTGYSISHIITSSASQNSDRFYIYKINQK